MTDKALRALLIDPVAQTVTETTCDPTKLENIYELIHADCFDIVTIQRRPRREMIFVDDMGQLKNSNHFFAVVGYPNLLAGYGLVMGCDEAGNTVATRLKPEDIIISWYGELEMVKP